MRADIASILDQALADMRAGASIDECLRRYPAHAIELEPMLRTAAAIRRRASASLPPSLEQWLASSRGEVERLARDAYARPEPRLRRVGLVLSRLSTRLLRRGAPRLAITALTTILICVMAIIGVDAAAARSLPAESLYPWKLFSEQTRLRFTSDPDARADLSVALIEHRVSEISALVELPDAQLSQYQQSIGGLQAQIPHAIDALQMASPVARSLSVLRLSRLLDRAALDLRRAPDPASAAPGALALAAEDMLGLSARLPVDATAAPVVVLPAATPTLTPTPEPTAQPSLPVADPARSPTATPVSSPTATSTIPIFTAPNPGDAAGAQNLPTASGTPTSVPTAELSLPTVAVDGSATPTQTILQATAPPSTALPTRTTAPAPDLPTPLRVPNDPLATPPTATGTATSTPTSSPPTLTATSVSTSTPTSSATPTSTATALPATPTATSTPTSTSTATSTPTSTPIPTATSTPTSTPIPTATSTPTPTTTSTPTSTSTATPTSTPTSTPTATAIPEPRVHPILECVARIDNVISIAYFGYVSDFTYPVEIQIGAQNRFTSGPADQGQPTIFLPDRSSPYPDPVFGVAFTSDRLVWSLNGRTATASHDMQTCDPLFREIGRKPQEL